MNAVIRMLALSLITGGGSVAGAAEFFAAPRAAANADGSRARPWDLATALSQTQDVGAGDTLWITGGTYRGAFTSYLSGSRERPVVIRAVPEERATVDFASEPGTQPLFSIRGDWTILWGIEFTCSDPTRETDEPGSWPEDIHRGGVEVRAAHARLINLVVHDAGVGIRSWADGAGGEVYGCLLYNNGWRGPDRGHGHGIYAQNEEGTKRLAENIVFHQFGNGIACYGSSDARLDGFHLEGNVVFNNGAPLGPDEQSLGVIVGGECPARRITIVENHIGASLRLGYPWGPANGDAAVKDNYVRGSAHVRAFDAVAFQGNTVVGEHNVAGAEWIDKQSTDGWDWDGNRYYKRKPRWNPFSIKVGDELRGCTFALWREATGFDRTSRFREERPAGTEVFLRENRYEPGRAHLVVYNWDGHESVDIDLQEVLDRGQNFRIVNAQDFYGPAVLEAVYRGRPISLPMRPTEAVKPVGLPDCSLPVTGPEFGVFVVLPRAETPSR